MESYLETFTFIYIYGLEFFSLNDFFDTRFFNFFNAIVFLFYFLFSVLQYCSRLYQNTCVALAYGNNVM